MRYRIPSTLLSETFDWFRRCGEAQRECQVLWTSEWALPAAIIEVVHPQHLAHPGGFELASDWINGLWLELARAGRGIRVQVHTHPKEAFHSGIDDDYPIIHSAGFLSLVIPDFASGPVGFERAYLAEITSDGAWREVSADSRLEIIE
jgi:hypothetical protein